MIVARRTPGRLLVPEKFTTLYTREDLVKTGYDLETVEPVCNQTMAIWFGTENGPMEGGVSDCGVAWQVLCLHHPGCSGSRRSLFGNAGRAMGRTQLLSNLSWKISCMRTSATTSEVRGARTVCP